MSNSTISPNMNLVIPTTGAEQGPQYAYDVDDSLTLIDQHDHTTGRGVQITPAGININTALPFNQNPATNMAYLNFQIQTATPGVNTLYENGVDLYFVDALGNNIRLTKSGGVAGTPGSIANLVVPASATYVAGSSTFVWQSNVNTAANLDAGSILLRNLSPNSTYALTLAPPAVLSSNYSIILPVLPSVNSIVRLDSSGNMTANLVVDNSTLVITSNTLQVAPLGITDAQIAEATITGDKLAPGTIPPSALTTPGLSILPGMQSYTSAGTYTWAVPANVTRCIVVAVGGGGGGGGGNSQTGGTGGATYFNGALVGFGAYGGAGAGSSTGGLGPSYADFYQGGQGNFTGGSSQVSAGNGQPSQYAGGGIGATGFNPGGGGAASSFAPGGNGGDTINGAVTATPGNGGNGAGGGGGGGVWSSGTQQNGGAGGGGGCKSSTTVFTVIPNSNVTIIVGSGGVPGAASGFGTQNGGYGGDGAVYIYY